MALTHQDQTISDLSDMIKRQWDEIERLKRDLQRLEAVKADRPTDDDQAPPPHY